MNKVREVPTTDFIRQQRNKNSTCDEYTITIATMVPIIVKGI